jgi:hypothetical protein
MDYSLLVGIHNLDQAARERASRNSPSPMTVRFIDFECKTIFELFE